MILRGPDAMRAFYRDLGEPWSGGAKLEVEELIDAGHQVLVLIRFGGRGKMSGAEVEAVVWNLWTFRDGEPVRWTYFGEDRASPRSRRAVGVGRPSRGCAAGHSRILGRARRKHPSHRVVEGAGPPWERWEEIADQGATRGEMDRECPLDPVRLPAPDLGGVVARPGFADFAASRAEGAGCRPSRPLRSSESGLTPTERRHVNDHLTLCLMDLRYNATHLEDVVKEVEEHVADGDLDGAKLVLDSAQGRVGRFQQSWSGLRRELGD